MNDTLFLETAEGMAAAEAYLSTRRKMFVREMSRLDASGIEPRNHADAIALLDLAAGLLTALRTAPPAAPLPGQTAGAKDGAGR